MAPGTTPSSNQINVRPFGPAQQGPRSLRQQAYPDVVATVAVEIVAGPETTEDLEYAALQSFSKDEIKEICVRAVRYVLQHAK